MSKHLNISIMNYEDIRAYCISKPGVTEGFPFNETALVFKVMNKMFALLDLSEESRGISLKCDPELAIEWNIKSAIISEKDKNLQSFHAYKSSIGL